MARDLVCFSHLRWDFVYQRPNHLMARAARDRRVYFVEEPLIEPAPTSHLRLVDRDGVTVATPVLPADQFPEDPLAVLRRLLDQLVRSQRIEAPVVWYYTPMSLPWSRHLECSLTVYDSMDYLAGFRGAPPQLLELEAELLTGADLVFCGGASLYRRMQVRHGNAHCFPSSVDLGHFRSARMGLPEPADQAGLPRPRIGYAGVIDERIDLDLIDGVAAARPEIEIILVGPLAKIDESDVPNRPNIHGLGMKAYAELPSYLAGWDVGWMPFAQNDATRYISPTKTPEYLAAGLPVVSTSIHDVVDPYGRNGLVAIADSVEDTCAAIDAALAGGTAPQVRVDAFLATRSWDRTWAAMARLIDERARPALGTRDRRVAHRPATTRRRERRITPVPASAALPLRAASRATQVGAARRAEVE